MIGFEWKSADASCALLDATEAESPGVAAGIRVSVASSSPTRFQPS